MRNNICRKCDCSIKHGYKPIFGKGSKTAKIMIIGRNPSYIDKKVKSVFNGTEGEILDSYLTLFNFNESIIYKSYAVKCMTNKRYPTFIEIVNCSELLKDEILEISPKIVLLMGSTAIKSVFPNTFGEQINLRYLNNKHIIKDGIVYLFTYNPIYASSSKFIRSEIYDTFITLLNMYRVINPIHYTNINL